MSSGVIFDRDGTLIDFVRDLELGVVTPAFHPDQIRFLPGVIEGLRRLAAGGLRLAIATNQPGAAKGQISEAAIDRTMAALVERLGEEGVPIAAWRACRHHPVGGPGGDAALVRNCACRKPAPGMLLSLMEELGLDPAASWMVGDTSSDLGAARAAGLRCALVIPAARCELCPLREDVALGLLPDLHAARFDALVDALLAAL